MPHSRAPTTCHRARPARRSAGPLDRLGSHSGLAVNARIDCLHSFLRIAEVSDVGVQSSANGPLVMASRFNIQDEGQTMAITVDILPGGPRRVSADVSYGDGAAAGPIIPIRWMVQRRTDKDLLIRMQQMLHLQPEHSAPGIVPIPATPAELDILLKQLRAWGGIVSPTARAAFARSAASGHGLMELGFIAVLPPVQELETTTVEEAMDAGRFFAHCCNEGCPVHATLRCTGCRGASYCSSDCQKKAWRTHKAHCGTPEQRQERQAKAAAIGPPKDEAPSVLVSINKGLPKELGHVMIGRPSAAAPPGCRTARCP